MAWTKMQTAIVIGTTIIFAVGASAIVVDKMITPSTSFIRITGHGQIELYTVPPRIVETAQMVILTDGKSYHMT